MSPYLLNFLIGAHLQQSYIMTAKYLFMHALHLFMLAASNLQSNVDLYNLFLFLQIHFMIIPNHLFFSVTNTIYMYSSLGVGDNRNTFIYPHTISLNLTLPNSPNSYICNTFNNPVS